MIENVHAAVSGIPLVLQALIVVALAAIPFIESYGGAFLGSLFGVAPVLAIIAAIVGNGASMTGFVYGASALRARSAASEQPLTPRRARLKRNFDRWGVPGVSLLGQWILPSQLTAAAMVGFGASRQRVIAWQLLSITLWAIVFGVVGILVGNLILWSEQP